MSDTAPEGHGRVTFNLERQPLPQTPERGLLGIDSDDENPVVEDLVKRVDLDPDGTMVGASNGSV